MPTKTPAEGLPRANSPSVDASDVFSALTHPRRRRTLRYLSHRTGAVGLGELAEHLALLEGHTTWDINKRILTSLYQSHLPKLADSDIVTFDVDREEVWLSDAAGSTITVLEAYARISEI